MAGSQRHAVVYLSLPRGKRPPPIGHLKYQNVLCSRLGGLIRVGSSGQETRAVQDGEVFLSRQGRGLEHAMRGGQHPILSGNLQQFRTTPGFSR